MDRYVIMVAGGKGLRMGGAVPRQFLPIDGRPVLMRSIDAFVSALPDIRIILVLPAEQHAYWQQLCRTYRFDTPVRIAPGGETRFHSVSNGLALVPDGAEDALVGVHDGVRPFVSAQTIIACYQRAAVDGAVVPVVPVVETVRRLLPDGSSRTEDREQFRLVQTPQVFRAKLLKAAYSQSFTPAFTDDASVVEAWGHPVSLEGGNPENIKLTRPADLKLAQGLLGR